MRRVTAVATVVFTAQTNLALSFCNHVLPFRSMKSLDGSFETSSTISMTSDRRTFFGSAAVGLCFFPFQSDTAVAASVPSITLEEFETILKDSAKSVQIVEFSGPRSEQAIARLVDGTVFEISGLVDSATDPRSPLKLVATCRSYKVPTKFLLLENAVSSTPKKKKVYMNARVQEAAQKEKEKRERMAQDEAERLAELYRREGEEGPLL
eukprot:CAMPEP_0183291990 /NCGR_PEP_ID=MMETSP0160_2-20130417/1220_1 /TAXON_ID=2839 ORGANISM="Odontella Sinensis, Strain Grunow 1884" /NCGR_SAMPLE_ID=MMETSP0160_2 /ASSEMBLY_ACC=CAM_ASM_000250 /LENGTH=208 /DNA_ID=CAMNT_0025452881 /DNA_START=27 /DNA_END=653 /DNA_ORIENTATION=+